MLILGPALPSHLPLTIAFSLTFRIFLVTMSQTLSMACRVTSDQKWQRRIHNEACCCPPGVTNVTAHRIKVLLDIFSSHLQERVAPLSVAVTCMLKLLYGRKVRTTPFLRVKTVISHFCFSSPLPRFPPATDRVTSTSLVARANLLNALLIFWSCSGHFTILADCP